MKPATSLAIVLACLASASSASAQGAAQVLEQNAFVWLDQNSRLEYPADLDGDGQMELVGWWSYWSSYNPVQVFFWSQDRESGTWTEQEDTFGSGSSAYAWESATAIGDFDADGKDEMAILHHWGIEVFEPNQNGVPIRIVDQDYVPNISAVDRDCAVLDFDGDGRDDIALVAGDVLHLLRSVPADVFVPQGFDLVDTYAFPAAGHLSVACADAEGDPALEILVLRQNVLDKVHVFSVTGQTLSPPRPYVLEDGAGGSNLDQVMMAEGDVDGDGDADLVCFGSGGNYQVLRRDNQGYQVESPRVGGPATDLADINGDGALDGICCGGGSGNFLHNDQPSTFEICLGDGQGNFDGSVQFAGIGAHHVTGAVDFDGDGDMDVLGGRAVLLGKSEVGGTFCEGTPNSTGAAGVLHSSGSHSVAAGGPFFGATGLPGGTVAILIAADMGSAGQVNDEPFWDGTLCLQPFLARLQIATAYPNGAVDFGGLGNWNQVPWNVGSTPGQKYGYQVWYRDNAAGLTGANTSSAMHVQLLN